jgi:hypothetical protein
MGELRITPQMLSAGRATFMRHRRHLDDLYCFYEADLSALLRALYKAMDAERNRGTSPEIIRPPKPDHYLTAE